MVLSKGYPATRLSDNKCISLCVSACAVAAHCISSIPSMEKNISSTVSDRECSSSCEFSAARSSVATAADSSSSLIAEYAAAGVSCPCVQAPNMSSIFTMVCCALFNACSFRLFVPINGSAFSKTRQLKGHLHFLKINKVAALSSVLGWCSGGSVALALDRWMEWL